MKIVPVKFHNAGRQYNFDAHSLELKPGNKVIVETDRGRALAIVVTAPVEIEPDDAPENLKSVLRHATDEDIALKATNTAREKDAYKYCLQRIQSRKMEMKLVRAEYAFDGSKIIFFFTADGRIDFRELVKDLAHHFHTRIEMRQIGVRDEAKLVGGLGICGRELCCCSFLTEFNPVSVKMAKEQGLALNPTKISGQCGRLLCCLSYEFETYCEHKKGMPKCGKKVCWQNQEWEVASQNILGRELTLRNPAEGNRTITMDEYEADKCDKPAPKAKPEQKDQKDQKPPQKRSQKRDSRPPRGDRKPDRKAEEPQSAGKPTDQGKPGEEKKALNDDGTPRKSKRRRRGRRRPRGGRKPSPKPQGD